MLNVTFIILLGMTTVFTYLWGHRATAEQTTNADSISNESMGSADNEGAKDTNTGHESDDNSPDHNHHAKDHWMWFGPDGKLTSCGREALQFIQSAPKHGLRTKNYKKILHITEETSAVDAEKMMNAAILSYIEEVTGSKARNAFAHKHPFLVQKVDPKQVLKENLTKNKDCSDFHSLIPATPHYKALQKALIQYQHYLKKAKQKGDPAFKLSQTLKKGSRGKDVVTLRNYLSFYAYLDSTDIESGSDVFDEAVEEAIKKFQEHHNEESDGVVGAQTQRLFHLTVDDRIALIRLNLQRWRYLQYPLEDRYIIVNIPGYQVEAIEDGKTVLSMKAVVGMPSRKTPLFKAPLTHFVFNPTWTVPDGIFYKDKLPKILEDPDYLERMGAFMKSRDGTPIDITDVNWYDPAERPRITYPPGRTNPLGQIKFDIKNPFTIYLHDTNEKIKFQKNKRAKSSGCIRLERPLDLLEWINKGEKYSDPSEIQKALSTKSTSRHALKKTIPIYFVYITTWVDGEGHLRFSDDPYRYDAEDLKNFKEAPYHVD